MNKMYVGNLPFSVTEESLKELFQGFGEVTEVNLIIDRESGYSKGFGFVTMADKSSMIEAIKKLDGNDFEGRDLRVNEARPKEDRPSGGGGGGYNKRY